MSRLVRTVFLLAAALVAVGLPSNSTASPLRTGFVDTTYFGDPGRQEQAFDRARAAGASVVRLVLDWRRVAPATRSARFDPTNPADPAYRWSAFDREVLLASARGLDVIATVQQAPRWASGSAGHVRPDAIQFGLFARAAARRYSGSFTPPGTTSPLPRIRFWQAWNEPNRDYFLMPQYQGGRIVSPALYRSLVARFADGVHGVNTSNLVIGGGLAPLGRPGKPAPLVFMRRFFCLSRSLRRSCDLRRNPVDIDVWSHHPYTSGGPLHHAAHREDVALGDLPQMRRVLRAAVRAGHIRPGGGVGFWVTEFAWDSRPPDPQALRSALHARWVAEALYRMWRNGVAVVTWFKIQDDPLRGAGSSPFQSGFYTTSGRAKRSLTAFRFPVVAFARRRGVYVWGRTPTGQAGVLAVELKVGRRWRPLGTLEANASGIFSRTYRTRVRRGAVRATLTGTTDASLPFSLLRVRDRFVNPFGCGGSIPC